MIKENKLLLFANSKHREQYIINMSMDKTIETTNFTTLNNFLNVLFNKYKNSETFDILSDEFSIFYIKEAIENYKNINKISVFIKQPDYYKLSSDIYSLYSELLISKFLSGDDNFFDIFKDNKNISEMFAIIDIYKKKIEKENKTDNTLLYYNFLNSLNSGHVDCSNLLDYNTIEILGFENLAQKYLAFLTAIKNGYNKNINIELPYNNKILDSYKKNISIFNTTEKQYISNFSNSIINNTAELKNYKNNIHFITGFGIRQECYTAIDKIIDLVKAGTALYDIALIFDNAEEYHDLIVERLAECGIDYEERFALPLWQIPVIPIITSIFSVINTFDGVREVNVEELAKILSSAYIDIEGLDNSKIRNVLYNNLNMFEIMPENNFEKRLTREYNDKNISSICSIVHYIYKLIKEISNSKNFNEITDIYKLLLRKFNIAVSIEKNKTTLVRDNNALAEFIEKLNELSKLEVETDYKDYHTVLNIMLRDLRLTKKNNNEKGISLLSSYDARGLSFKHIILLGANNNIFVKKAQTFILDKHLRENINNKYNKNIISSVADNNILPRLFFYNIVSNLKDDSNIYFSFRFKDNNGSLELPSVFVEEIFYSLTEQPLTFNNLKEYGALFRKDYIPNSDLVHTEKEALISLFYYKKANAKLPKNILDINNSMHLRLSDTENKDILIAVCREIFSNPLSVSDIEDMLNCRALFIDKKMFGVAGEDERTIGINYGIRGEMYHHCFCHFYKTIKEKYSYPLVANKIDDYKNIVSEIINNLEKEKYYRLYDEKEINKNSLKDEIKTFFDLYIGKEIERFNNDSSFIPELFEDSFKDYNIYKTQSGIDIKIRGRIDRIDFHYDNNKNINGVRIVDYKSKSADIEHNKLEKNIQLLLYLDYAISKYIKDRKAEKLEIAYSVYSYEGVMNNYFMNFSDTEAIKDVIDNKLKTAIFSSIEEILEGDISYNPSIENCKNCQKKARCSAFS